MNKELNNMDDFLDDSIGRSLRKLGFTFPRNIEDFKSIEERVKKNGIALPERLQDPYKFLGEKTYSLISQNEQGQGEYFQQLAQAAREGKLITDDIKKRMAEDKLKANKKNNQK